MKTLISAALLTIATAVAAPASAAVTFKLDNVVFTDGAKINGRFTTDDRFTSVTDFFITTEAGLANFFFGQAITVDSGIYDSRVATNRAHFSKGIIAFDDQKDGRQLELRYSGLNSNSTVNVAGGTEYIFGGLATRDVESGTLIPGGVAAGAVPEPATWAMMIGGIGLTGGVMRRRRAVKTTVSFA